MYKEERVYSWNESETLELCYVLQIQISFVDHSSPATHYQQFNLVVRVQLQG